MGNNLGIGDLTIGVDPKGVESYKEDLKIVLLETVKNKINDVQAIQAAFDLGWQGESRERFDEIFRAKREEIIRDLEKEYKDIEYRLEELKNNFINQDQRLMDN